MQHIFYLDQNIGQCQQSSTSIGSSQAKPQESAKEVSATDNANSKLPPRPADYDYFYYQDEEGNWWNEYDDMGYEFDPNRYEGDEESSTTEPVPNSASKEASAANDNKKTNKDVDSSKGISELKVWERSFNESKILW